MEHGSINNMKKPPTQGGELYTYHSSAVTLPEVEMGLQYNLLIFWSDRTLTLNFGILSFCSKIWNIWTHTRNKFFPPNFIQHKTKTTSYRGWRKYFKQYL